MSIVLSVIEKNKKIYIASDRRGIKKGIINDNYKKIYELFPGLYFGMTGTYEPGIEALKYIKKLNKNDILKGANLFLETYSKTINREKLAITIAGKNEKGSLFIWQKNDEGKTNLINGSPLNIDYCVSSNDKIKIFGDYLREKIINSPYDIREAMVKTIEYASEEDSSISREYDFFETSN